MILGLIVIRGLFRKGGSAQPNLYLTVDSRLQFANARGGYRRSIRLSPPPRVSVLELKFVPEHAENIDVITNAFPFRMARFSKYVTGMQSV